MNIASAAVTGAGLLPLGGIVSGILGLFGLAGMSWSTGAPTIIDMTELFHKFETEIVSQTEQMIA